MIYVIFIVFALISFGVQKTLQNKFENYSKVPIPNGLTGKDITVFIMLPLLLLTGN